MSEDGLEFPHIYCINLKASTERRKRMEQRFLYHGLIEVATFIEAIPRYSNLINYYSQGLQCPAYGEHKWRGELACYASHLKAIRQFLHDSSGQEKDSKYAIICEDDILLANNFLERYVETILNLPEGTPLVTMSYMLEQYDTRWAGKDWSKENLLTINPKYTWGAQIYLISLNYAMQVLSTYDKPFIQVENPLRTSEVIIRESKGLMAYPPLAIEDGIDSDREPPDLPFHHKHFAYWGYKNYSKSETEDISPLAKL